MKTVYYKTLQKKRFQIILAFIFTFIDILKDGLIIQIRKCYQEFYWNLLYFMKIIFEEK